MKRQRLHKARLLAGLWAAAVGLLLLAAPAPAFAHDNIGGDELAVANWMLVAALVVAAMGVLALVWGARAGQFSNVEESKYRMLDTAEDYDALMAAAAERDRARKAEQAARNESPAEAAAGKQAQADRAAQI